MHFSQDGVIRVRALQFPEDASQGKKRLAICRALAQSPWVFARPQIQELERFPDDCRLFLPSQGIVRVHEVSEEQVGAKNGTLMTAITAFLPV